MKKEDLVELERKLNEANPDGVLGTGKIRSASLSVTVHRHNTDKNDYIGVVSYYNKNPIKHYYMNILIWFRGKIRLWQQFWLIEAKK